MGKFVFQDAADSQFTASQGDTVEDGNHIFDADQPFFGIRVLGIFRAWVDDKIMHTECSSGLDSDENLVERVFTAIQIGGGYIDIAREGGVEGLRLHPESLDFQGRPLNSRRIFVVQVCGRKNDLDQTESTRPNRFQTFHDICLVKTPCGYADRPVCHSRIFSIVTSAGFEVLAARCHLAFGLETSAPIISLRELFKLTR